FQAAEWYARRVALGGWHEEVWYSMYQLARIKHASAMPWPGILNSYLEAYQYRPSRLEPLLPIARHYRETGQPHLSLLFSRIVVETPYPDDWLFNERSFYDHELPMEYARACCELGLHGEAQRVCDEVLANPRVNESVAGGVRALRERSRTAVNGG